MSKTNKRLDKFLHDSKATLLTKLGLSLQRGIDSPQIVHSQQIQSPTNSTFAHRLESSFYGCTVQSTFSHPERCLYGLQDIWLTGSEAHLFFSPRHLFTICPTLSEVEEKKIRRPIPALAKGIDDPVFILAGRAPGNRAHFLIEHLPRLLAAQNHIANFDQCKILVTPNQLKWQQDFLQKIGIAPDRLIEAKAGSTFCHKAYYIPLLSRGDRDVICPPAYYKQIRELFQKDKARKSNGTPLFLSRQDANSRRLSNEDAIFRVCQEFFPTIERLTMSKVGLDDQLHLFQQAPAIIGPHGQPFRNLLFASQALAIQLTPGQRSKDNEYHLWARNFNCIGSIGNNQCITLYNNKDQQHGGADWNYDQQRLRQELSKIIGLTNRSPLP